MNPHIYVTDQPVRECMESLVILMGEKDFKGKLLPRFFPLINRFHHIFPWFLAFLFWITWPSIKPQLILSYCLSVCSNMLICILIVFLSFLLFYLDILQKMGKTFEVLRLQLPIVVIPSLKIVFEDHRTYASPTAVS